MATRRPHQIGPLERDRLAQAIRARRALIISNTSPLVDWRRWLLAGRLPQRTGHPQTSTGGPTMALLSRTSGPSRKTRLAPGSLGAPVGPVELVTGAQWSCRNGPLLLLLLLVCRCCLCVAGDDKPVVRLVGGPFLAGQDWIARTPGGQELGGR